MDLTLKYIEDFLQDNSLYSVLVVALVLNIFYDIIKKTFFFFLFQANKKSRNWAVKNVNLLRKYYKNELKNVKLLVEQDFNLAFKIINDLFRSIFYISLLIILISIIDFYGNKLLMYCFLGSATPYFIFVFISLIVNFRIVQNAKRFDLYEDKMKTRIKELKSIQKSK